MIELYDNLRKTLSEKVSILANNHIVCQLSFMIQLLYILHRNDSNTSWSIHFVPPKIISAVIIKANTLHFTYYFI